MTSELDREDRFTECQAISVTKE